MKNKIHVSPSILSADFGRLNEDIASVEPFADSLHVDIMDGHFVPNLTFGAPVVRSIKTRLPLHCHLMVEHPERYVEAFKKARAALFIFHIETTDEAESLIAKIRNHGMKVGISVNPETNLSVLTPFLHLIDLVLIMSVHPGFGGQAFIPLTLEKIRALRKARKDLDIAVDGGINAETGLQCVQAGANILVAGSYIFGVEDRAHAIESLKNVR